jgi:hypothetical protein
VTDALGLRDEKDAFVTRSPRAAVEWLKNETAKIGMAAAVAGIFDSPLP